MEADPDAEDYYRRIGCSPASSPSELRAAVRACQKTEHPDRSDRSDASARFVRVMDAADCLTDPDERDAYDTLSERFPNRAAEAYERWTALGRPGSPARFTPPGMSSEASGGADGTTGTNAADRGASGGSGSSEKQGGSRGSAETSTGAGQRTGSSAAGAGSTTRTGTSGGSATSTGGTADDVGPAGRGAGARAGDSWYEHRQSYERPTYDPPSGVIGPWLRTEVRLSGQEIPSVAAVGLSAAVAAVALVPIVLLAGLLTVLLGAVLAVPESMLRAAGVLRFDAFGVVSISLTLLLEFGVYLTALGLGWIGFDLVCLAEDDDHLGHRLRAPELLYVLPTAAAVVLFGSLTDAIGLPATIQSAIAPVPPLARLGAAAAATLLLCNRAVRIARETPPSGGRETVRSSVAVAVWSVVVGALFLAGVRRGLDRFAAGVADPYGETLVWYALGADALVAGAVVVAGAFAALVTVIRAGSALRSVVT